MNNADLLEAEAIEARRRADVAKHSPMTDSEWDQLDARLSTIAERNGPLLQSTMNLWGDYTKQLAAIGNYVARLRAEALYWKQKCNAGKET